MNGKAFAMLTIFVLISVTGLSFAIADNADADPDTYTIEGIVGEIGDTSVIPSEKVKITITAPGEKPKTGETDEDGKFSIELTTEYSSLSNLIISCDKEGYSVFSMPDCMKRTTGDIITLNLLGCSVSGKTYTVADDFDHCIVISSAYVPVNVIVTGSDEKLLKGATVSIYRDDQRVYSGETGEDGTMTTSSKLPIGEYKITVHCSGYEDAQSTIVVTKLVSTFTVSIEEKEIPTYAGMTTYQIMMMASLAIGMALILISYALYRRCH